MIENMNIVEYRDICQVHQWLEVRSIPHTHIVNEQPNKKRAIAEKRMGKSKGFPDLLIFLPNGVNVAIEMKRHDQPKLKASPEQLQWLSRLSTRGFKCAVCHGLIEAVEFLKECGAIDDKVEF